ncbi:Cof-type HAD-IIB family hydrolase [Lentilactobacillus senioris]|uniref:Cof-type HAD-IIB family hydrolase n=1 Tax=Lentilactobacillus senioris TaxID=931534 RepID=UPI0022812007|nr:Cof-type HAD-IIB family hydrolase [Lentilactobacillus senioris]MCY9806478.1 Cof-type HAD-IIB family hydrolase [Lentilactobacillus senioris]
MTVFASDMDGTFLNDQGNFDALLVQRLLAQMKINGDHLVVASSNHYEHLRQLFANVTGPISYVCDNGAHVVNETGQTIYQASIPLSLWQSVVEWLVTTYPQAAIIVVTATQTYSNQPADSECFVAARYFYADLQAIDLSTIDQPAYKLDVTWPQADVTEYKQAILNQFGDQVEAVMSGMNGIDIMLPGVSKLTGIQRLLTSWQLTEEQLVAFGDNDNDYAMLQAAQQGWAMKNAAANLLARISQVTPLDNNHSGVQQIMQQLL